MESTIVRPHNRCSVCNGFFDSMMDDKCNTCRSREKEEKALLFDIRRLTNIIDRVIEKENTTTQ